MAGKSTGKSHSAKYFASNPESRKKKNEYNKKYHATPERIQYREQLNKFNRQTEGYGDGMDASHTRGGKLTTEKRSTNRARNGKNGKPTKR